MNWLAGFNQWIDKPYTSALSLTPFPLLSRGSTSFSCCIKLSCRRLCGGTACCRKLCCGCCRKICCGCCVKLFCWCCGKLCYGRLCCGGLYCECWEDCGKGCIVYVLEPEIIAIIAIKDWNCFACSSPWIFAIRSFVCTMHSCDSSCFTKCQSSALILSSFMRLSSFLISASAHPSIKSCRTLPFELSFCGPFDEPAIIEVGLDPTIELGLDPTIELGLDLAIELGRGESSQPNSSSEYS